MNIQEEPYTIIIRRLEKTASEADITATINCMNDAFGYNDYPLGEKSFFCGQMELMPCYHRWILESGLSGGKVYVAETQKSVVIGSAVWFGPGEEWLGSIANEEQMAAFNRFAEKAKKKIPGLPSWWLEEFFPKYRKLTDESLEDPNIKLDSWHCQFLGVSKTHQRGGIGSKLIREVMEEASHEDHDRNKRLTLEAGPVEFYKTLGFVVKGKTTIEGEKTVDKKMSFTCLSHDNKKLS